MSGGEDVWRGSLDPENPREKLHVAQRPQENYKSNFLRNNQDTMTWMTVD